MPADYAASHSRAACKIGPVLALCLDPTLRLDRARPRPERVPGAARIAVRLAGVCDTDLQLMRGYMGYRGVLGHEFVGVVSEADDASWIGRRVVADINAGCGACDECRLRLGHHCARRTVLGILGRDGALAEETVVPERCLVSVPDSVSDDQAVFAEPLAAALHVSDALPADARDVAVIGDGKLGLLIALGLLDGGRRVTLIGHHTSKLALAERHGARALLERDATDLAPADAVVEATGSAAGLARALASVRARGTVVQKTTLAGRHDVDLSRIVIDELNVVGSRCGDLSRAIAVLAGGSLDPTPLIAARYPLRDAVRAVEHAGERGVLKVLVDPTR